MKKFLIISISICLVLVCGYSTANNQKYDLLIYRNKSRDTINIAIFHNHHMCNSIASLINSVLEKDFEKDNTNRVMYFCVKHND